MWHKHKLLALGGGKVKFVPRRNLISGGDVK